MNLHYGIGVDLGGTKIKTALVSNQGKIILSRYLEHAKNFNIDSVIDSIINEIGNLLYEAEISSDKILGIGMGVPGIVDYKNGTIVKMPNIPKGQNVNIKKILEDKFMIPALIDNDVNVTLLGEKLFGNAKNFENAIMLAIGTGLGGAILINGELYRGSQFAAAEFGHTIIKFDGKQCTCGGYGCLEEYASGRAIIRNGREFINSFPEESKKTIMEIIDNDPDKLTARHIFEAARKGGKTSKTIIETFGTILGIGIASLINILNPEAVIIGGAISQSYDDFYKPLMEAVKKRAFSDWKKETKILKALLGADAGVIGAASLLFV
jgi:glucokinase